MKPNKAIVDLKYSDYINELALYFDVDVDVTNSFLARTIHQVVWLFLLAVPASFIYFAYATYLLLIPRRSCVNIKSSQRICISRSFATSNKLSFLKNENVIFLAEKPTDIRSANNLYALPFFWRLRVYLNSFRLFLRDILYLLKDVSNYVPSVNLIRALKFYILRVPHKVGFEAYLEYLLGKTRPHALITGNKEDRFALAEQSLSKKLRIPLVCYPHGLEYAMKLPRGVVGDEFYCLSAATQTHYSLIYNDFGQHFVYSEEIAKEMLGRPSSGHASHKKVVFFPESRGIDVNQRIVQKLVELDVDFCIKLHPSDSIRNYLEFGVSTTQEVTDFDIAIAGNVVLARKSTVLLEALYSGSTSCAVLIDDQDKRFFENEFPSLWDSRIHRAYSFDDLVTWLNSQNL